MSILRIFYGRPEVGSAVVLPETGRSQPRNWTIISFVGSAFGREVEFGGPDPVRSRGLEIRLRGQTRSRRKRNIARIQAWGVLFWTKFRLSNLRAGHARAPQSTSYRNPLELPPPPGRGHPTSGFQACAATRRGVERVGGGRREGEDRRQEDRVRLRQALQEAGAPSIARAQCTSDGVGGQ